MADLNSLQGEIATAEGRKRVKSEEAAAGANKRVKAEIELSDGDDVVVVEKSWKKVKEERVKVEGGKVKKEKVKGERITIDLCSD